MFGMIVVLIIAITVVWAFLQPGLNPLIHTYNDKVSHGGVSVQTSANAKWSVGLLLAIPGLGLGGIALSAIVRSIEVSQSGN